MEWAIAPPNVKSIKQQLQAKYNQPVTNVYILSQTNPRENVAFRLVCEIRLRVILQYIYISFVFPKIKVMARKQQQWRIKWNKLISLEYY